MRDEVFTRQIPKPPEKQLGVQRGARLPKASSSVAMPPGSGSGGRHENMRGWTAEEVRQHGRGGPCGSPLISHRSPPMAGCRATPPHRGVG
jgi:hypothetical protein